VVPNAQHSSVRQRVQRRKQRESGRRMYFSARGRLSAPLYPSQFSGESRSLHCRVVTKAARETHSGLPLHTHTERLHTSKRKLRRASRRRLCFRCLPNESNFAEVKTNSPPAPLVHLESLDYLRFASLCPSSKCCCCCRDTF
jgi:hypothetical protein